MLSDLTRVVLAPVRVVLPLAEAAACAVDTVTRPITQPVADVVDDLSRDIADVLRGK